MGGSGVDDTRKDARKKMKAEAENGKVVLSFGGGYATAFYFLGIDDAIKAGEDILAAAIEAICQKHKKGKANYRGIEQPSPFELQIRAAERRKLQEKIKPYLRHLPLCETWIDENHGEFPCTCGLVVLFPEGKE
jgi:hypothetical protein